MVEVAFGVGLFGNARIRGCIARPRVDGCGCFPANTAGCSGYWTTAGGGHSSLARGVSMTTLYTALGLNPERA